MNDTLARLEATIAARASADPSTSYVASLFAKGRPRIARKLGEEAVELVVAALAGDRAALVGEAADLLFHLAVLLAEADVPISDVMAELERREGQSGIDEKASRGEREIMSDDHRSGAPNAVYLRSLSPLHVADGASVVRHCKMCGGIADLFDSVDFTKSCVTEVAFARTGLMVDYYRCRVCEFIFTPFCDAWTSTDFGELIYNAEYVLVDGEYTGARPRRNAEAMAPRLQGAEDKRILDYGSGSGIFGDELGRYGFKHVASFDPLSAPVLPEGRFDVITSFESIEHSPGPIDTLDQMLALLAEDGCILIGQTLQPPDIGTLRGQWWYVAPRNGHISFFSDKTIEIYAISRGLLFDNCGGLFALSRPGRSALSATIIQRNGPIRRRRVLIAPDRRDEPATGWHSLENAGGLAFRWTAAAEVNLGVLDIHGAEKLVLPVLMPANADLLTDASLVVGEREVPLRLLADTWLVADVTSDTNVPIPILLRTRPPVPSSNPLDSRHLGLAIIAGPSRAAEGA